MLFRVLRGALLMALLSLGFGALAQQGTPIPPALLTATNSFGFNLYAELAKTDGAKNLIISPVSLEYALMLLANGAHGDTATQIESALAWGKTPLDQVNAGFLALTPRLSTDPRAHISLANSLWLTNNDTFRDAFLQMNKLVFGAETHAADFGNPDTDVDKMNAWVKTQTHGSITKIISKEDVDATTTLVALSALAFKGDWTTSFDPKLTSDQPFTLADGTPLKVKMMRRHDQLLYFADDQMQMVKLPYGNGNYSMIVILPRAGQTLNAVAGNLFGANSWPKYLSHLAPRNGTLQLPRFTAGYLITLNEALKSLGMPQAFDGGDAEFTGLIGDNETCWLQLLIHKTALEVSETGTKTATAPGAGDAPPVTMTVNHPFLFAIQQKDGALLLLGSIAKPE